MKKNTIIVSPELIQNKIYSIRGHKVMFDHDLAKLYETETKYLNKMVKRNIRRFPDDFMFKLNKQESEVWLNSRFQIGTLEQGRNVKYFPNVFTELGIAMLSSVLKSEKAVQMNIQIVRTFTKIREMIASHHELREKIDAMENKYDQQFKIVFEAIRQMLKEESKPKNKIGF